MSHFSKSKENTFTLTRSHAFLVCNLISQRPHAVLEISGDVKIARINSHWHHLPKGTVVQGPDGTLFPAIGRYYISAETLDPVHAIIDVFQNGILR